MTEKVCRVRVGIGQDSHRFLSDDSTKPCVVAGLMFSDAPGLSADSDGDVVFHAICNAITSVTGVPILGKSRSTYATKMGSPTVRSTWKRPLRPEANEWNMSLYD